MLDNSDCRRLCALALLGWRYCGLSGLAKQADQFSQFYVKAAWGRRTADMAVCFKAAFTSGGKKEHLEVLEKLVQQPRTVSVELLLRFAAAFNLDVDMALLKLASCLLGRLEPEVRQQQQLEGEQQDLVETTAAVASLSQLLEQALARVQEERLYDYLLQAGHFILNVFLIVIFQ
jgi:hypothetical protein